MLPGISSCAVTGAMNGCVLGIAGRSMARWPTWATIIRHRQSNGFASIAEPPHDSIVSGAIGEWARPGTTALEPRKIRGVLWPGHRNVMGWDTKPGWATMNGPAAKGHHLGLVTLLVVIAMVGRPPHPGLMQRARMVTQGGPVSWLWGLRSAAGITRAWRL